MTTNETRDTGPKLHWHRLAAFGYSDYWVGDDDLGYTVGWISKKHTDKVFECFYNDGKDTIAKQEATLQDAIQYVDGFYA